jgi:small subunit ribosomal protein S17
MKGNRRRLVGKVTSDKMQKTVVVQVDSRHRHPLYGKVVSQARRFMAHDELGATMGDTVRIVESRPISKRKRWVVEEIVNRGYHVVLPADEAAITETTTGAPSAPEIAPTDAGDEGSGA